MPLHSSPVTEQDSVSKKKKKSNPERILVFSRGVEVWPEYDDMGGNKYSGPQVTLINSVSFLCCQMA